VLLLEEIVAALNRQYGEQCWATGFPSIKFLAPLAPDEEFDVVLTGKRPGLDSFEIRAGESRLVVGTVSYTDGVPA